MHSSIRGKWPWERLRSNCWACNTCRASARALHLSHDRRIIGKIPPPSVTSFQNFIKCKATANGPSQWFLRGSQLLALLDHVYNTLYHAWISILVWPSWSNASTSVWSKINLHLMILEGPNWQVTTHDKLRYPKILKIIYIDTCWHKFDWKTSNKNTAPALEPYASVLHLQSKGPWPCTMKHSQWLSHFQLSALWFVICQH